MGSQRRKMSLKLLPLSDRFVLSEVVLAESGWIEWHGLARFRISTRLFVKDDVVFCAFTNGQGERCNICGYSSKFGKICGEQYGKPVYATYSRSGRYNYYTKSWGNIYNKSQLVFIVPPEVTIPFGRYDGEYSDRSYPKSLLLAPEVRAMLLERLCTTVSASSVSANSRRSINKLA